MLYELGAAQTFHSPASAVEHLSEALELTDGWPRRGEIALALSEALALSGRFADAVTTVQSALAESGDGASQGTAPRPPGQADRIVASLQAASCEHRALGPVHRAVTGRSSRSCWPAPTRVTRSTRSCTPTWRSSWHRRGHRRTGALRHAREAVRATSSLMSLTSTALPEAVTGDVVRRAERRGVARGANWQGSRRQRGRPLAHRYLGFDRGAARAVRDGDVQQALAYGEQATTGGDDWISMMATAFMIPALVDRGAIEQARALLAAGNLNGQLGPTWPYNVVRHARGRLLAAAGDHASAVRELVSGSPAARRVACPGTYWRPRQAAGGSFLRLGPGEVDVGADFRQLLLGLPRRLRVGDVDRTYARRIADRAVDQGMLRVDALDPEVPRLVGPIADQVADSDMLMLRQLAVRVATRTTTCVVWLPGAISRRGMQPAGIRGTWIRLCRLPADHPMTCVTWGDEGERPEN